MKSQRLSQQRDFASFHFDIFEILGRNIYDVHKDFRGVRMKKGRKTIHHLRPKMTMVVPGESVNAAGLEGTLEKWPGTNAQKR